MNTKIEYSGSRYAEPDEIMRSTVEIDWNKKKFDGAGFPVYSDLETGKVHVASNDIHTLIIGGTGSKKTLCGVLPTALSMIAHGESIVITDSKMEAYRHLIPYLEEKEVEVNILNFRNPEYGNSWNPLSTPYNYYKEGRKDKAIELLKDVAESIFLDLSDNCNDVFWTNTAADYFVGLALVLFEEAEADQITLEGIVQLEAYGNAVFGGQTYLSNYMQLMKEKNPLMYRSLYGTVTAPTETKGSIQSVFRQPIGKITCQDNLNDMLSKTDFNIFQMGEKQTVTFLIMPDEKSTYNALISMFLKQSYELLILLAEEKYEGVLPARVNWILEEAGNIPAIPDFENMLTASRSRNIRFVLVFQSQQQIERKYRGAAKIIIGNCDCIVYLNSKDMELLEYISKLAGYYKSRYSHEIRPLISVNELQHLSKENAECIIFLERQYPFKTRLPIIYDYKAYLPIHRVSAREMPLRPGSERTFLDFQELVKQKKIECMKREINKNENPKGREYVTKPSASFNATDIDFMIAKIDKKIAELESEGEQRND